jgi:Anp1
MLNQSKIFIATPMYGGMNAGFYTQSVLTTQQIFGQHGIGLSFSFMFNESLITRARNALVHQFLKSDHTHLMFIDADIRYSPEHIIPMIEADKDIICGIYPKKEINWASVRRAIENGVSDEELKFHTGSFVVNLVDYAGEVTVPIAQPVEIFNGGTGFMLIKRAVFDKLSDKVPSYTNDVGDLSGAIAQHESIKEYFATSIEPQTNRLLSEDYHFCRQWRQTGGQVWAAPWCQLSHIGTYAFEGRLIPSP